MALDAEIASMNKQLFAERNFEAFVLLESYFKDCVNFRLTAVTQNPDGRSSTRYYQFSF